jgi:hypothetical protein
MDGTAARLAGLHDLDTVALDALDEMGGAR